MRSSIALVPMALALLVNAQTLQAGQRLRRRAEAVTCSSSQEATGTITAASSTQGCGPSSACAAPTATSTTLTGSDGQGTVVQQSIATCAAAQPGPQRRALRRTLQSRAAAAAECPLGLTSCPTDGLSDGSSECVDLQYELAHCGACGQDCTTVQGAFGVGCEAGRCVVLSCEQGFEPTADRQACMPSTRPTGLAHHRRHLRRYSSF